MPNHFLEHWSTGVQYGQSGEQWVGDMLKFWSRELELHHREALPVLGVGRGGWSQRSCSPPAEVVESQATTSRPVSGRSTPSELRWTASVHLHLNWCIYFRTLHLGKSMLNLFISGTCPTLIEVSHTHQRYHWCPASTPKPDPSCWYWQKPPLSGNCLSLCTFVLSMSGQRWQFHSHGLFGNTTYQGKKSGNLTTCT